MDVIVTGGAGFVGHHLARAHAEAGDRVVIVDSLAKSGGTTDAELRALLDRPNVRLLTVDLANEVPRLDPVEDRKSTRLNSSHGYISYAVFCLKKKTKKNNK